MRSIPDEENKMVVEGYALRFNQDAVIETPFGTYTECIDSKALDNAKLDGVVLVFNHDNSKLLASTKNNSLNLSVDEKGLKVKANLINTSTASEVFKLVKEGIIDKMSFSAIVDTKQDEIIEDEDGNVRRVIKSIKRLFDVSAVTFPAYETTELVARDTSIDTYFEIRNRKRRIADMLKKFKEE